MAFTFNPLQLESVWWARGMIKPLEAGEIVILPEYVGAKVRYRSDNKPKEGIVTDHTTDIPNANIVTTYRAVEVLRSNGRPSGSIVFIAESDLKRKTIHDCPHCECIPLQRSTFTDIELEEDDEEPGE